VGFHALRQDFVDHGTVPAADPFCYRLLITGAWRLSVIVGDVLRALRELKRKASSPFVFIGAWRPFTPLGFAKLLAGARTEAKLGFKVHPHMLRHACGYAR
jgi:integrase